MRETAVTTFTRRQVVDMFPEFLTKRAAGFGPIAEAYAKEVQLPRAALGPLSGSLFFRDGDVVRRETYVWRSPYAIKRPDVAPWADIVKAGLAEETDGGWRLTPGAMEIARDVARKMRAHLRSLPLPKDALKHATDALEHLAGRIPPDAERAARARRLRALLPGVPAGLDRLRDAPRPGRVSDDPGTDEPGDEVARLSSAVTEMWSFRDDCHVAAWQAAGYEGSAFDVLSYVWSSPPDVSWTKIGGHGTIDALAKALEAKQDRPDVERNVDALVHRGDLERDSDAVRLTPQGKRSRDAIEEDTDRRYFRIWDLDEAATARLGEDLRAVIDAIPKA